ncbi:hypothetical protein AB4212_38890, partial [Streptomyces sp. 2MCAF27]
MRRMAAFTRSRRGRAPGKLPYGVGRGQDQLGRVQPGLGDHAPHGRVHPQPARPGAGEAPVRGGA